MKGKLHPDRHHRTFLRLFLFVCLLLRDRGAVGLTPRSQQPRTFPNWEHSLLIALKMTRGSGLIKK